VSPHHSTSGTEITNYESDNPRVPTAEVHTSWRASATEINVKSAAHCFVLKWIKPTTSSRKQSTDCVVTTHSGHKQSAAPSSFLTPESPLLHNKNPLSTNHKKPTLWLLRAGDFLSTTTLKRAAAWDSATPTALDAGDLGPHYVSTWVRQTPMATTPHPSTGRSRSRKPDSFALPTHLTCFSSTHVYPEYGDLDNSETLVTTNRAIRWHDTQVHNLNHSCQLWRKTSTLQITNTMGTAYRYLPLTVKMYFMCTQLQTPILFIFTILPTFW
jgi:hypothetical protein